MCCRRRRPELNPQGGIMPTFPLRDGRRAPEESRAAMDNGPPVDRPHTGVTASPVPAARDAGPDAAARRNPPGSDGSVAGPLDPTGHGTVAEGRAGLLRE